MDGKEEKTNVNEKHEGKRGNKNRDVSDVKEENE